MSYKTQETYASILKMMNNLFGTLNEEYYLNYDKVMEKLHKSKYAITSQKLIVVVIGSLLKKYKLGDTPKYKDAIEKYKQAIVSYNNTINHIIGENILSKKEEDKYIDFNQIIEIHKKLLEDYNKDEEKDAFYNYVLLSLYVLFPPRRLQDYTKMKIVQKEEKDKNYNYLVYDKNKMKFVFNTYKTSNKYGTQIFEVPTDLKNILKKWIEMYHKGSFLISNNNGEEVNDYNLSKYITNIIKKYSGIPAGVSMIRHAYISHITDNTSLSLNERQDIANKMAHSIYLQLQYYKGRKKYN